ncbi:MAG: bifunctional phosphoribosylaminoimidazolecarboxamide formyltransferase/IMP cyclohydrolase [Bacteroidia bacterium]|jgi:phosphoribosylaminoimidazolecarboxamide formyltransferase/IMP cyclohydrolase
MTSETLPIRSALISVYSKEGLAPLAMALHQRGIEIWSTGGTRDFLEGLGCAPRRVEDLTGYPSILGGRVKTLHPKIFGGILHRSEHMEDLNEMAAHEIPPLDLVVVDLYPFEETLRAGGSPQELIEKIDIGGISLLRAAAKNHSQCTVISSSSQYPRLLDQVLQNGGTTWQERETYAAEAFAVTSHYDQAIFGYLNRNELTKGLRISNNQSHPLRYGENPHQTASFYGPLHEHLEVLSGKALSYNNLLDVDSALNLLSEFQDPTFVVVKHNNACGLASREQLTQAWKDALAGDPVSAFGGVLAANRCVELDCATAIDQIFYEVLIAPDFSPEALELLTRKKNRILIRLKSMPRAAQQVRSVLGGYLVQEPDSSTETKEDFRVVTLQSPSSDEVEDMLFALKIVKHTRSNAIILVRNRQLIGSGTGQSSRIDAMRQAAHKARTFDFEVRGAVMASDAFFPFADSVEVAYQEGIRAVVQPGGSVKDQDSIDFCDRNGMAMVMTGRRHFKH